MSQFPCDQCQGGFITTNLLHSERSKGSLDFFRIHRKSFDFQSWAVNRLNLPGKFQPTDTPQSHNPHTSCTETNIIQCCQHSDPRFKTCTRVKIWMALCGSGHKMRERNICVICVTSEFLLNYTVLAKSFGLLFRTVNFRTHFFLFRTNFGQRFRTLHWNIAKANLRQQNTH